MEPIYEDIFLKPLGKSLLYVEWLKLVEYDFCNKWIYSTATHKLLQKKCQYTKNI